MKSKIQFYVGKGGVGKSTVSSLISLLFARMNKVLLVSLDSAHNLCDIFSESFSDKPKNILENLTVIEVDVNKKINEYLSNIENDLIRSNTNLSAFNLLDEFKIIRHAPGLEEYGLLKAFSDIIEKNIDMDYIIFDMPPTALTMKFFNLSARSLLWIEKLIDLRKRIKEKKEIVSSMKIGSFVVEKDRMLEKLLSQQNYYLSLQKLHKSENTEINLVINQDSLSINESKKIIAELQSIDLKINNIIVNKYNEIQQGILSSEKSTNIKIPFSQDKLIGIENLKAFTQHVFF